ncbi:MAG: polysaccharide biosynthesis C-terminal domain-containing protein, partial [Synergistaceae bacterium]|nr:polysaccharide biosynthesis C-terminal domain-containing protein [Synergistaceae bacterium]
MRIKERRNQVLAKGDRTVDLTQGVIWKKLLLFFLPILAGSLFQQLYTTADAVIVGQFAGKMGLAAIDSVYNLLKLPVNFFVGLSTGATIIISQYFGRKNRTDLSKAVHTAVAFAFAGGLSLSVVGIVFAARFLHMLDIPDDIFRITLSYVRIYFSGLAASMLYNIGAGILRALGDSKTPFYYLSIASVLNILLDLLFVGVFHWGVAGAALATVLVQMLSAVLIIRAL